MTLATPVRAVAHGRRATTAAPQTMGAALLSAPRRIRWTTLEVPSLRPGELLVRVGASGICGSDLAAYAGHHPYKRPPVVLGHELAGTVTGLGSGVQSVAPGERVCAAAFSPCDRCEQCQGGRPQLCSHKANLSAGGWHGSFAEYVVLRENMAFALPPGIPLTRGALVEPLAIGVHTARVAALGGSPSSVVAVGGGTIGLCCLIAAGKLFGATTLAVDIGETKRKLALAVGAAQFVDAAAGDAPAAICDALDGGADVTFLASGHPRALDDAVACTRSGGTVVVVSFFPGPARLDMNAAVRREVSMKTASLCTRADVETVLEWAGRGELAAERLVTHRFPLAQAGRALQMLAGRSRQVGKILLEAPDTTSEDVQ